MFSLAGFDPRSSVPEAEAVSTAHIAVLLSKLKRLALSLCVFEKNIAP
jgi:hypothetical protein